ncbi:pentatricopeptide repeat-containing protein At2g18520, mitochondrial-like [Curcuma longa]|uniref:pentatricopeptide repeat-containing protein At2g18520, mitochondrial-like n=1 Tax=Curcuma longa TaxID=136217 RepID=UPI003D9EE847
MAAPLRRTFTIPFFRRHFLASYSATATSVPNPSLSSSGSVSAAKSAIRSETDAERLASLFESVTDRPSFYGDRSIYKLTIEKLARHRRTDLIERVLDEAMHSERTPKSEGFLIRLIDLYSKAGMVDQAVRVFENIPSLAGQRSERSFCALLSAFLDNGRIERLQDAFNRSFELYGAAPGIASYNIYLKALCSTNKIDEALVLFDQMRDKGIEPDISCYNSLLHGYFKKGDYAAFDKVLKEICKKGLSQNVGTYNCRIAALCAKGKSSQAEELLDVMKLNGIFPDKISFNTLINRFCKQGDVDSAIELFKRMKDVKGPGGKIVLPDSYTYIKLTRGLVEKGEFGKAVEICKECLDNKWALPFKTMKELIDGLIKSSRVDEARGIIARMKKGVVKGDAKVAWKKIKEGFAF